MAEEEAKYPIEHPPGHFASPYPDLDDVRARHAEIFDTTRPPLEIDLRFGAQLRLLEDLLAYYPDLPYGPEAVEGYRYHSTNRMLNTADAMILGCMIRHIRPRRVIEVGSGFSSAVMLDMADHHLDPRPEFTFIEPFPDRLLSLIDDPETAQVDLVHDFLQNVDVRVFDRLQPGDVLFIDSSHVVRAGSDVNALFFEVLPRLRAGVFIHLHDIFYPFEYLSNWIYRGRCWQENYLLRAFLMHNDAYQVELFLNQVHHLHRPWLEKHMPVVGSELSGSFWMRKVR